MIAATEAKIGGCALSYSRATDGTLVLELTGSWTLQGHPPSADEVRKRIESESTVQKLDFDSAHREVIHADHDFDGDGELEIVQVDPHPPFGATVGIDLDKGEDVLEGAYLAGWDGLTAPARQGRLQHGLAVDGYAGPRYGQCKGVEDGLL